MLDRPPDLPVDPENPWSNLLNLETCTTFDPCTNVPGLIHFDIYYEYKPQYTNTREGYTYLYFKQFNKYLLFDILNPDNINNKYSHYRRNPVALDLWVLTVLGRTSLSFLCRSTITCSSYKSSLWNFTTQNLMYLLLGSNQSACMLTLQNYLFTVYTTPNLGTLHVSANKEKYKKRKCFDDSHFGHRSRHLIKRRSNLDYNHT